MQLCVATPHLLNRRPQTGCQQAVQRLRQSPAVTRPTLLEVAANHVDDSVLRSLHEAGIWSDDVRVLHAAALSLNRTALSFVIENGDWEDGEVSDALKLQSAVYLFTDCLLQQRALFDDYRHSASKKAVKEALSQLQKTTTHQVHDLDREDLLKSATELFVAATSKVDNAGSPDPVTSSESHSEGEPPIEARTAAEFMQLRGQGGFQRHDQEKFGRLYLHALLVMLCLQPEHSLSKTFTLFLASQLTGQNLVDPSERISCSAFSPERLSWRFTSSPIQCLSDSRLPRCCCILPGHQTLVDGEVGSL